MDKTKFTLGTFSFPVFFATNCTTLQNRVFTSAHCFFGPVTRTNYNLFCAIVLHLVVYHVCFQDGKLCLLVANDKLDGK
jgi:hypothetical protein